jgi:UDP-glucose 4-epimerase
MASKAVVFGGAGFLGSHVSDVLSDRGWDVVVFDVHEAPYLRPDQTMFVGDILSAADCEAACEGADIVYNFAGIADLDDARTRPLDTAMLNVVGNINVIEAALKVGAKRYVYASSIYVYSQKGGFYRCSKQASEVYIEEYQRKFGLEFTILRYGTLYGPRADVRNSVYRYLRQAKDTKRIVCDGTGEEMRDYIHVRDAARSSVDILAEDYVNQHVILSGHNPTKFHDMLSIIAELVGGGVEVVFTGELNPDHYAYTPYSYAPKIGYKLVNHVYVDVGQGLLECLDDMYPTNGHAIEG